MNPGQEVARDIGPSLPVSRPIVIERDVVPRLLHVGVAMCFIGHGAFGLITKEAWLPYFDVVGINEPLAWRLMPWIGTIDIAVGFLALTYPCRSLFVWASLWTIVTALLRPLAEQGWSEFFERAGNYGLPLALLALAGLRAPWFGSLPTRWTNFDAQSRRRAAWVLRFATATLLAGHASCGVLLHKPSLAQHYAIVWPAAAADLVLWVGYFEFFLALMVLVRATPVLLFGVAGWKLATEMLFIGSGVPAPMFDVIERGGSYLAPLGLALIMMMESPRSADCVKP